MRSLRAEKLKRAEMTTISFIDTVVTTVELCGLTERLLHSEGYLESAAVSTFCFP